MEEKKNNGALRKADMVFGSLLAATSIFFFIQSLKLIKLTINKNTEWFLSAGLVPMLVSVLLLLCSIILIVNALKSKISFKANEQQAVLFLKSRRFIATTFIIVWFAAYIFLFLNWMSYVMATLAFLIGFMAFFSEKSIKKIIIGVAVSIITTLIIAYCFGSLVGIPLP